MKMLTQLDDYDLFLTPYLIDNLLLVLLLLLLHHHKKRTFLEPWEKVKCGGRSSFGRKQREFLVDCESVTPNNDIITGELGSEETWKQG